MPRSLTWADPGHLTLLVFAYLGVALLFERHTDQTGVLVLGGATWLALWAACRPLEGAIRARVAGVVLIASAGEVLASVVLGLYAYRRGGIPLFVPPGHGLIYLAGHHLARSDLLRRRAARTVRVAAAGAVAWAVLGLVGGARPDVAGALATLAVLAFLRWGREPVLFAAMLVVVAVLELYGTAMGTWSWVPSWPLLDLPAGNPPSGVAAGYCLFDALALRLAPWLYALAHRARATSGSRRRAIAVMAALAAALVLPAAAQAHPLGNFSVNHLTQVSVSADRVELRYILDQAEIPTFQQRGVPEAEVLARTRAEALRRLVVTVDGRRVAPRPAGLATLEHPPGQGGLETTRVEIPLAATVRDPRRVVVRDGTFRGRVGWRAVVARPGKGTAVRSSVPARDPTRGLRAYPEDLLESPPDVREARLDARPGAGTLSAPDGEVARAGSARADEGFTKVLADAAAGRGVLVLLLLAAFGWGAVHALSPGHGKAMVAAYLVGTRGTPRQAIALGAIVTATHTAGVFALGAVTLALSAYVLPETLYPWLNLVSGLLVVGIGAVVLRANVRRGRAMHHHHHGHRHHHDHGHRPHENRGDGERGEGPRGDAVRGGGNSGHGHGGHGHAAHGSAPSGRRGLLAMGAAAGLIPCPSALVVLLGAIAQGQVALGMLLIVAFSAGLAATLTALGLAVVLATHVVRRVHLPERLVTVLPAASAVVIVAVGCVLTARALPLVAA
jgi:ABC-type nickel/cobalt efflux system permease component RcnA